MHTLFIDVINIIYFFVFILQKGGLVWGGGEGGGGSGGTASVGPTNSRCGAGPAPQQGQGLVHWMSVMAEHMNTVAAHDSTPVHYMWNGGVEVFIIYAYLSSISLYLFI